MIITPKEIMRIEKCSLKTAQNVLRDIKETYKNESKKIWLYHYRKYNNLPDDYVFTELKNSK